MPNILIIVRQEKIELKYKIFYNNEDLKWIV